MATLTADELVELRRGVSDGLATVNYTKVQINAVLQAIEDLWESPGTKNAFNNAIEGSAPGTFTVAQKKKIVAYWLRQKFGREGF